MSALRTWKCPACGKTNLLGSPCTCDAAQGGATRTSRSRTPRESSLSGLPGFVLTLTLTSAAIVICSLALAESGRPGYGVAVAVAAWLGASLWRLGLDFDEGIDVRQLLFPAPLDWMVKWERLKFFWTGDHPYFRAVYIGCWLALIIIVIVLVPTLRKP